MEKTVRRIKRTRSDIVFDVIIALCMVLVAVMIVYPIYFILCASISDPIAVTSGKTMLGPSGVNFDGYNEVLTDMRIWTGYRNTILYTIAGVLLNLAVTMTCAYAMTVKDLPWKKFITFLIVFTMLFDGGMIPRFLIVRGLGIYNTIWAMILPKAAWVFCIIIARTFIQQSIPYELYEAAQSEGCSFIRYFFMVVIPLSPALISILILYYGTNHWNSFFDAMLYLQDQDLYPLQLILRDILIAAQSNLAAESPEILQELLRKAETVKYAIIVFASLPMLIVYPFLQRYFVKGVMIGAIKG